MARFSSGSTAATALLDRLDDALGRFRRLAPRTALAVATVEPEEDRATA